MVSVNFMPWVRGILQDFNKCAHLLSFWELDMINVNVTVVN